MSDYDLIQYYYRTEFRTVFTSYFRALLRPVDGWFGSLFMACLRSFCGLFCGHSICHTWPRGSRVSLLD